MEVSELQELDTSQVSTVAADKSVEDATKSDFYTEFGEFLEAYYFLCNHEISPNWKVDIDIGQTGKAENAYWVVLVSIVLLLLLVWYVKGKVRRVKRCVDLFGDVAIAKVKSEHKEV